MAVTVRGTDILFNDGTTQSTAASGSAVRAWVNFNGTGTVAIRASLNVSSITDIGLGVYNLNFTTALADGNYAAASMGFGSQDAGVVSVYTATNDINSITGNPAVKTTSAFRVTTAGAYDITQINVTILR